jgi:hypothetical protein
MYLIQLKSVSFQGFPEYFKKIERSKYHPRKSRHMRRAGGPGGCSRAKMYKTKLGAILKNT